MSNLLHKSFVGKPNILFTNLLISKSKSSDLFPLDNLIIFYGFLCFFLVCFAKYYYKGHNST